MEQLYLVLDYVNGGELFTHLQKDGLFSEERSKFYAAELVLAIEHLHKYSVIYRLITFLFLFLTPLGFFSLTAISLSFRDIKPENVLLDSNGHLALTDFGLAKQGSLNAATFCGTAEYLAPEILQGTLYGLCLFFFSSS